MFAFLVYPKLSQFGSPGTLGHSSFWGKLFLWHLVLQYEVFQQHLRFASSQQFAHHCFLFAISISFSVSNFIFWNIKCNNYFRSYFQSEVKVSSYFFKFFNSFLVLKLAVVNELVLHLLLWIQYIFLLWVQRKVPDHSMTGRRTPDWNDTDLEPNPFLSHLIFATLLFGFLERYWR